MKVLTVLTLSLFSLPSWGDCHLGCHFQLGNNGLNHPLIFQKVDERYKFVVSNNGRSVFLRNGQQVIATCQGQSFEFCSDKFGSVQLLCKHNQAFIAFNGNTVPYSSKTYKLGCKAPVIQHFPYPVQGCYKFGVMAAFVNHVRTDNPNNNLVKVVEYCYDPQTKKTLFAHFKVRGRDNFLDQQYLTNVGSSLSTDVSIIKGKVPTVQFYTFGPNLGLLGQPSPNENGISVGHRATLELINSAYRTAISQSSLNVYPEWNVLRSNNLLKTTDILLSISRSNSLNVYSGTTDAHLSASTQTQPVLRGSRAPFYEWSLVQFQIPMDKSPNVVLVAVNVVNLPQSDAEDFVFCEDICSLVSWLAPLGPNRTNTNHGYLFCCSVEEASKKIPELPQIFQRGLRTTTTPLTVRGTTRTNFVARTRQTTNRRTIFAPFPCRQEQNSKDQESILAEVANVEDIVLDSSELELPSYGGTAKIWQFADHFRNGGHKGRYLVESGVREQQESLTHNQNVETINLPNSGEASAWIYQDRGHPRGEQPQGSLEKLQLTGGSDAPHHWGYDDNANHFQGSMEQTRTTNESQDQPNHAWDFFWSGVGSQETEGENSVQLTSDQQNQQSHNTIPSHGRKVLKGHVVGFLENNEPLKVKSSLTWQHNKPHKGRNPGE